MLGVNVTIRAGLTYGCDTSKGRTGCIRIRCVYRILHLSRKGTLL